MIRFKKTCGITGADGLMALDKNGKAITIKEEPIPGHHMTQYDMVNFIKGLEALDDVRIDYQNVKDLTREVSFTCDDLEEDNMRGYDFVELNRLVRASRYKVIVKSKSVISGGSDGKISVRFKLIETPELQNGGNDSIRNLLTKWISAYKKRKNPNE